MFAIPNKHLKLEGTALENTSLNIMIADRHYNIVYLNQALKAFLKHAEPEIKKGLPHFNPDILVGTNIDTFHQNPGHIRKILDDLSAPRLSNVQLGEAIFYQRVVPLFNKTGERVGTMVEWDNPKTLENDGQIKALNDYFCVVQFDLNGNILDANANFLHAMEYERAE
ncbi:MAG: hypothetical protein JO253_08390, partial [Alphaproteobacteria bacterium]|nr:hypothetical protein [Alphaproteobacteria bacterium]